MRHGKEERCAEVWGTRYHTPENRHQGSGIRDEISHIAWRNFFRYKKKKINQYDVILHGQASSSAEWWNRQNLRQFHYYFMQHEMTSCRNSWTVLIIKSLIRSFRNFIARICFIFDRKPVYQVWTTTQHTIYMYSD